MEVHAFLCLDVNTFLAVGLEAWLRYMEGVVARSQIGEQEGAVGSSYEIPASPGKIIRQSDTRARHQRALRVLNDPGNLPAHGLRLGRGRQSASNQHANNGDR